MGKEGGCVKDLQQVSPGSGRKIGLDGNYVWSESYGGALIIDTTAMGRLGRARKILGIGLWRNAEMVSLVPATVLQTASMTIINQMQGRYRQPPPKLAQEGQRATIRGLFWPQGHRQCMITATGNC